MATSLDMGVVLGGVGFQHHKDVDFAKTCVKFQDNKSIATFITQTIINVIDFIQKRLHRKVLRKVPWYDGT